ncbi:protein kinase, putative [Phytophthora infestans T30-4]|uniref:Protein kinase, putative n=1 Tax=Phytophthora infestans (strain T30-4) TaxID=403677 RepID=D0MVE9_PHYIT|nr:protein kinase, putative [Phytophthora infestans T30-4]EEY63612.1 protein kinase, putative [Phytophthora infestans T30-4]|eukprot:XP_002907048.1 protein kinase, putative [Phytophthora infestans T30-4]
MKQALDVSGTTSGAPRSISFLGEGATAQVYLAEHETSGAHVAIKVIDKLLVQRAQLESKVRQEMVLHAELQHPHVLHVEGVFEDARNYYMVLEYCARRSLSAVTKALPGRKMDEHTAKKIFRQVLMGVAYLHASGVIHRDLKLANLLLNGNGEVKISDFGLAARLGDDHVTMCGTPNFIAPEVLMAEDEPYDEAVDVWSLGCILYCLLLGKPPFEGRKVSETLENVANAGQNPLQFPDGFSSSASDLIKRLLTSDPRSRPSAQQILLHPWLREQTQKRAPSGRRRSLPHVPQPVPPHPRAASRSPEKIRESRRAAGIRLMREEESVLSSSSSSIPAMTISRRRTIEHSRPGSKQRGRPEAPANRMRYSQMSAAFANSSSDSSSSPEDDSMIIDDYSDLSELSLPTTFNAHAESRERNEEKERPDQTDEKSLLAVSRNAGPIVSVVMHLELQDVSCLGIPQSHEIYPNDSKVQLQWSCKEPAEVGRPPTFELKVSSGWEACYDQASGVLTATTPEGDPLRYEIPGVSGARAGSSAASSSSTRITQRAYLPPLVRFCQCLALRAMQLRQIALRGHASKLPFIHYDALPESLLESFRYRSSLLTVPHQVSRPNQDLGVSVEHSTRAQKGVEIAGVGCGYIDATGDLRVVFLDGAQLTLAASGLQLRFRPSWASDVSNSASVKEDVFELLTTSSMSSFLPSAVKQKLENIPEFIRRLKAVN